MIQSFDQSEMILVGMAYEHSIRCKGGYVKFLKVDTRRRIVSGVFEFSVGLRGDKTQVDHVNYGSFRVHYIL